MRLLAIDAAGDGCSAGVFLDGETLALLRREGGAGQAERLPLLLEAVLAEPGCGLGQLDALAVSAGPGSFTGIRTGLAAARGLALAAGLRGFAVSTLAAVAAPHADEGTATPIAAVLDARRGQVYLQLFGPAGEPLAPPEALPPAAAAARIRPLGRVRLVGGGAALVLPLLAPAAVEVVETVLDARTVAMAAFAMAARGVLPVSGFALRPLYLRDADARPDAGRPLLPAAAARLGG